MHPAHAASPPLPDLNESLSEQEGKCDNRCGRQRLTIASMKAPPKRKGSSRFGRFQCRQQRLNESLHLKVQSKQSRGHPGGY